MHDIEVVPSGKDGFGCIWEGAEIAPTFCWKQGAFRGIYFVSSLCIRLSCYVIYCHRFTPFLSKFYIDINLY